IGLKRKRHSRLKGKISLMTQLADSLSIHQSNFSQFDQQNAICPPWLDELRNCAMKQFHAAGFPEAKQEDWRFTNIAPIVKTPFKLAQFPDNLKEIEAAAQFSFGKEAACELVFVNGIFAPQLSRIGKLPRNATVRSLAQAISDDED